MASMLRAHILPAAATYIYCPGIVYCSTIVPRMLNFQLDIHQMCSNTKCVLPSALKQPVPAT